MNILDRVKTFFQPAVVEVETKATEDIGRVIAPELQSLPPDNSARKFLEEGIRSWAFIAMCAIADEISTSEIMLKKKRADGEMIESKTNPALELVNHPNSVQTREELWWQATIFLLSEGEAPILLNRSENPDGMFMLDPSRLEAKFKGDEITEYKYTKANGKEVMIEAELIVLLKFPNLKNPFRGTGKMNYIRQTLDLDNFMEEYLRLFFYNDATPNSVLETDSKLSKEIIERLKQQLRQKHGGLKNKHKNLILESGLKWHEISSKFGDLQMTAMQDSIRDKVLSAFKVPKSIVGITKDVNRANGENEDRIFAKRALLPLMRLITAELNQHLLPKFSGATELFLEFENPVAADVERDAKIDQIYITAGVYTVDEVRERMGLEPMEEEDKPEKPEKNPEDEEKKPKKSKKADIFVEIAKDMLREEQGKGYTEEEKEAFHNEKIIFTDDVEERFSKKLEKYFLRQQKDLINQIKGKELVDVDEKKEIELMVKLATPFLEEAVEKQSQIAYAVLASEGIIESQDELAKKFISANSIKLGESATETTKKKVQRVLRDWNEAEGSIADLKKRLKKKLGSKTRAEAIARTEVSRSAGWATNEVYKREGIAGKQWYTAKDERVCEFCNAMDGVIIPISKNFWNKGDTMIGEDGGKLNFSYGSVANYPLHVQCRCDLLPVYSKQEIPKELSYKKESKEKEIQYRENKLEKTEGDLKGAIKELEKLNELPK